jgi:hypothetical protein
MSKGTGLKNPSDPTFKSYSVEQAKYYASQRLSYEPAIYNIVLDHHVPGLEPESVDLLTVAMAVSLSFQHMTRAVFARHIGLKWISSGLKLRRH